MTITANPHEMLYKAAEILQERGQTHGDFENNFQLIADIFLFGLVATFTLMRSASF